MLYQGGVFLQLALAANEATVCETTSVTSPTALRTRPHICTPDAFKKAIAFNVLSRERACKTANTINTKPTLLTAKHRTCFPQDITSLRA